MDEEVKKVLRGISHTGYTTELERDAARDLIENLYKENKHLKKQLDYLRSGEYYNQLKFERDLLQDLVNKGEVSKEDKKFIDCTHRNTELIEEKQKLKDKIKKAIIYMRSIDESEFINTEHYTEILNILDIIKENG